MRRTYLQMKRTQKKTGHIQIIKTDEGKDLAQNILKFHKDETICATTSKGYAVLA